VSGGRLFARAHFNSDADYQRQRLLSISVQIFAGRERDATQKATRVVCNLKNLSSPAGADFVGSAAAGQGWRKGDQTALDFAAGAAHNDFIFSVIAEEEGFAAPLWC